MKLIENKTRKQKRNHKNDLVQNSVDSGQDINLQSEGFSYLNCGFSGILKGKCKYALCVFVVIC